MDDSLVLMANIMMYMIDVNIRVCAIGPQDQIICSRHMERVINFECHSMSDNFSQEYFFF